MTSQETVFMISLIKANFRRNLLFLCVVAFVFFAAIGVLFVYDFQIAAWIATISGTLLAMVFSEGKTPWNIKKSQMTALREQAEADADFEELMRCVPLHEYFEMN